MRISDWSSDVCSSDLDLEMQRTIVAEQTLRANFAAIRHRDARQQAVDQLLLPGAQGLALGAAIEAVERGRVAGLVSGHGGRVSDTAPGRAARSGERRVGEKGFSTGRSRGSP